MSFVRFTLATPDDDAALRQMLRENPMPGAISVTFEREPNYFQAAAIEAPFHQTIVARAGENDAIIGMGSRVVRELFVNGVAQPIGYMSQLRANAQYSWGLSLARVIAKGFEFYHTLHADQRVLFYLMSIIADNRSAQRLLTAETSGFPSLREYSRFNTYAIYLGRRKSEIALPNHVRLMRGNAQLTAAILACLLRNGVRKQFAPVWTANTLFHPIHTPGLTPEDCFLAVQGDTVVGCLACWDQNRFKQTVVRGYGKQLARWRPWLNLAAKVGGWPVLPRINTPFRHAFVSHLAVDDDNPLVFAALLRAVYNHAGTRAYSYVMLGLPETNPLCSLVTGAYRQVTYRSQIYLAAWADGREALAQVDPRMPGLEIAIL